MTPRAAARRPLSALAVLVLLGAAAPAEAQLLKRVRQMAQEKVADAVGQGGADRAAGADAEGAAAPGAAAPGAATPATRRGPLPITAERLDAFFVAMRPAIDRAERGRADFEARKAYEAAEAVYKPKRDRWETCINGAGEKMKAQFASQGYQAQMRAAQDLQTKMNRHLAGTGELSMAATEAEQRGDNARAAALKDSADVLTYRMYVDMMPSAKECGAPPRRPVEPRRADGTTPEQLVLQPAGMTRGQFGRLRERVAVYALTGGKEGPFTAEERATLDARAADLAKLTPLFRDGLLEWGQWTELGKNWTAKPAGS